MKLETAALILSKIGNPTRLKIVRMLVRAGTKVRVASRSLERADEVCVRVAKGLEGVDVNLTPVAVSNVSQARAAVDGVDIVIAAGASGIQLLSENVWRDASSLRVAIDLNAVPPLGIEGIDVMDKAVDRKSVSTYGAIGVGGTKMKIHKECIRRLFQRNDLVLDADEVFQIGCELEAAKK